jgi:hypothetical protein
MKIENINEELIFKSEPKQKFTEKMTLIEKEEANDDCSNGNWFLHENTYLVLTIIALILSELLPFIEEIYGVRIEGNGLIQIIKGLLTKDYETIQEGVYDILEEKEL